MAEGKWSVYQHTCPNGKVYIGITSRTCEDRWRGGHGYRNNKHFYSAIVKYGWKNIEHKILQEGLSKEDAQNAERSLIWLWDSDDPSKGYNQSKGGEGKSGFVPSAETRNKIRKKLTGTHRPYSVKVKLSIAHKGKHLSVEHREKISAGCKNVHAKAVLCMTTGKLYVSATEASRQTGVSRSGITACCRGEKSTCRGMVWAYVEEGAVCG